MSDNCKTILYVDDDADDREFLSIALKQASPQTQVVLAEHGVAALNYLNETSVRQAKLPCLIILDLNMPVLDGRQTFERIQANPVLHNIPTIVFTSSYNPADKALFGQMGVELITKPNDIAHMDSIATHMLQFCR